jgi:hypothetical protein
MLSRRIFSIFYILVAMVIALIPSGAPAFASVPMGNENKVSVAAGCTQTLLAPWKAGTQI